MFTEFWGHIENNSFIVSAYLGGDRDPVLEAGFFYGWEEGITYNMSTHVKAVSEDGMNYRATVDFDDEHSGYDFIYAGAYFLTAEGVTTTLINKFIR